MYCGLLWSCLASAPPLLADNPYRILVAGDSIAVGYTDNPNWTVPFEFGARSGLYTRLTNSGMLFQFVGSSLEPWNGKFGTPANTPKLDLRPLGQDHCEGYGGQGTGYIKTSMPSWLMNDWPDVILLMIGINDISSGSTAEPTAAEQNVSNIVSTVTASAPNTRLIVAQITPYSSYTAAITKYNTYIRNTLVPYFAHQGKYVATVDQYTNLCIRGTTNIDTSLYANGINHPNAIGYDRMAQTWFRGIQALLPLPPPRNLPLTLTNNGGFETPMFSASTHNINPAGTGWTFTVGATGAGTGIDAGNPYGTGSGSVAYEGAQQAFLQSSGNSTTSSIARAISSFTVGQYYQVSFASKAIVTFQGANPFQVWMKDGAAVTRLFGGKDIVPVTNGYTCYLSEPFRATSTNMTLYFSDHALSTVQKVSWIDAVSIFPMQSVSASGSLNGSQFKLRFNGFTNLSYGVIGTTNPTLPLTNWSTLGAAQWLSNDVFQFTDVQASSQMQRFYRVRLN